MTAIEERGNHTEESSDDLHALSAEVVDLFYTQAFLPGELDTEASVCHAFSKILLRHWDLCCVITYLRDAEGHLRESAIYIHRHLDEAVVRRAGELLAAAVESDKREWQVWLDAEDEEVSESAANARHLLAETDLRAAVATPIYVHDDPVGALAVLTAFPERLRDALQGIRFIATPLVIAVGNARRTAAMREQQQHIEQLVEELQQRSAALEEANRELQRVARYRSLFLARMSHELRTPLTAILGFAEILLEHENLTDAQRRFCEKIQSSGLQLQTSLNQLVDLSRLEAGHSELFLHEFSLREMLRESCLAVTRLAQKQDVKIECASAPELSTIVSDEGKLRQVLYNFFAFAIGRNPPGTTVNVYAHQQPGMSVRIEIHDEGEPLSDPSHLFEAVDIDAPNERGTTMNELGLVIAHRLIDVLGGTVILHNEAPHGLTISLDLPIRPTELKDE